MTTITREDVWSLESDIGALDTAIAKWRSAAEAFAAARTSVADGAQGRHGIWKDTHATSFFEYVPTLTGLLDSAEAHANAAKGALKSARTELESAQGELDGCLSRLPQKITHWGFGGLRVFSYPDDEEENADQTDYRGAIDDAASRAGQIREDVNSVLSAAATTLGNVASGATNDATALTGPATSGTPKWDHPEYVELTEPVLLKTSTGETVIVGGAGPGDGSPDEYYRVTVDPETGETIVEIYTLRYEERPAPTEDDPNAVTYVESIDETVPPTTFRIPAGEEVVVNAGGGNDRLEVPEGTDVSIRVFGGSGDDDINTRGTGRDTEIFGGAGNDIAETGAGWDTVFGGAGDDYADTGAGHDRASGGWGNDTVYGVDGNDVLSGGEGADYLDGGRGNDTVSGGGGNDTIGGGLDDDELYGNGGDDVMYGSDGDDSVDGGTGNNTANTGAGDEVENATHVVVEYDPSLGQDIVVKGSPEFVARVQSDLEMMRSSPAGHEQMGNVDQNLEDSEGFPLWDWNGRDTFEIVEYRGDDHEDFSDGDATWVEDNGTGGYSNRSVGGRSYAINYNPNFHTLDPDGSDPNGENTTPPFIVLYHEYGHVNQFSSGEAPGGEYTQDDGSQVPLIERPNVGLEWDHDGDPNTPEIVQDESTGWDYDYTENGIREEMGRDQRERY